MSEQLILDRYRPISEAGFGGFATVQLAWDTRIQRRVAIKSIQLSEQDLANGTLSELDEARTAALLAGSNIVGVYDFEVQGSTAYIIMEYVDGLTLTEVLNQFGDQLSLNACATIFTAVAGALETAHDNQVLHLDIKPDNILINRQGQVKVTDFGLSTLSGAAGFGAAAGGTIGYMPPEQMHRENLDARCDEWALASVTYEMLTGENPFIASNLDTAIAAIEEAEIVLPSLCRDDLDAQADDVIFYALDPDREERYETIADFAEEMEVYLGNPLKGTRELAVLVGEAREDFENEEDEGDGAPFFSRRRTGRLKTIVGRVFNVINVSLIGYLALNHISLISGLSDPFFWALLALFALAAALKPHLGAMFALLALCASLLINEAYVLGILFVVAIPCWWFFVGRKGDDQANTALAPALLGCCGLNQLTPLLIGMNLNIRETAINTGMALLLSFTLAGMVSASLLGWDFLTLGSAHAPDVQAGIWQLMQQPSTWCIAVSWLAAAGIARVFRLRRTRFFAFLGVVVASAVLLFAISLGAWLDSASISWLPHWTALAGTVAAAVLAGILAVSGFFITADEELGEDGG